MMKDNIVLNKSYDFAVRIVQMYQHLSGEKKEFVLSKQVLRSGTSIGGNVEEAIGGSSKKDFLFKMKLAYIEARETSYWLRLLMDTEFIDDKGFESIHNDYEELLKLLYTNIKSSESSFFVTHY